MKHQLYLNCQYCHTYFEYNGGRRSSVCSNRCKVALWRVKKNWTGKLRKRTDKSYIEVETKQLGHERNTFKWKPWGNIPPEVPINADGTIDMPLRMKEVIEKVDAMTPKERWELLLKPSPKNKVHNWSTKLGERNT